jgi:protocatechuate 3,4-dioxygenase beta subunit
MNSNERPSRTSKSLDRRQFIRATSLLGLSSMLLPKHVFGTAPVVGGCEATTDDILGPYYLAGSPNTALVAQANEPGTRLFLSGTVLANDCETPIPGVKIEVWQANAAAIYDTSQNFLLRGTVFSDENGLYAFETIMPGAYLNGNQYRPKHIHFKVTKPGFPDLITQLYFEGDPYIANDPWASQPDAAQRIIPLNSIGEDQLDGQFDIVLDGTVGIKPNRYGTDGDLLPVYPNPMTDRCSIHFNVFRPAQVRVVIADAQGREVSTLINGEQAQGRYTTQWDGTDAAGQPVSAGTYLSLLEMDGRAVKVQRILRV